MKDSLNTQKISRLIQKELSEIFQYKIIEIVKPAFITLISVKTSADYSISNIHLGIISKDKEKTLNLIEENGSMIRKLLGNKIANKVKKIPQLRFYLDESIENALKIKNLLEESGDGE